jgi:hypothetical protein
MENHCPRPVPNHSNLPDPHHVHLFRHVLLGNHFEGFRGRRRLLMRFEEIVHHVDERLISFSAGGLIGEHQDLSIPRTYAPFG